MDGQNGIWQAVTSKRHICMSTSICIYQTECQNGSIHVIVVLKKLHENKSYVHFHSRLQPQSNLNQTFIHTTVLFFIALFVFNNVYISCTRKEAYVVHSRTVISSTCNFVSTSFFTSLDLYDTLKPSKS